MRTSHVLPVRHRRRFAGRGLSLALLCALSVPIALPSAARAQAPRPGDKYMSVDGTLSVPPPEDYILVSIDAKSASLATLIDLLMEQGHVSYTLSQKLTTAPVGNVRLRKVPFRAALDAILKLSDVPVTYRVENGIYRILPRRASEEEAPEAAANTGTAANAATEAHNLFMLGVQAGAAGYDKRDPVFTISVSDAPLYEALRSLFTQAKVNYTIDPAVRSIHVTAAMSNLPLRMAVDTLLHATGKNNLTFRVENGIYNILSHEEGSVPTAGVSSVPGAKIPDDSPVPVDVGGAPGADASLQPVTIIVNNASLYQTLKQLFAQTRSNYSLDPSLDKARVTLTARKVPLRDALTMLLKASGRPLTYRVENGIYTIIEKTIEKTMEKQDAPPALPPMP